MPRLTDDELIESYMTPTDLGEGRTAIMSFEEDGRLIGVTLVIDPSSWPGLDLEEWRTRLRIDLDGVGSYGHMVAEVWELQEA